MKKFSIYVFIITGIFLLLLGCHKEISKDSTNDKELAPPNRIPPGSAEITGQILEILSIDSTLNENTPCSKAPCRAKVKIQNITYGAGFPTIRNNEIVLKFNFTLMPTTKEMFPNMDDSYPGLIVGDKFTAIVGFVSIVGKDQAEFFVNGYTKI